MAGLPGSPAGKVGIGVYMHKQYMHDDARRATKTKSMRTCRTPDPTPHYIDLHASSRLLTYRENENTKQKTRLSVFEARPIFGNEQ